MFIKIFYSTTLHKFKYLSLEIQVLGSDIFREEFPRWWAGCACQPTSPAWFALAVGCFKEHSRAEGDRCCQLPYSFPPDVWQRPRGEEMGNLNF